MKLVKRKTRKAIQKGLKKAIKKHGPKITAGLAGGLASALATLANTESPDSKGRKSNLAALSTKLSDAVTGKRGHDARSRTDTHKSKGKRAKKRASKAEELAAT
jgi:hypothetical protein